MKEFLSQNWIGALISLCSILVGTIISFIFYRKSIRKAVPGYQYKSLNIIDVGKEIKIDNINVFYKESKIERLSKTQILFWNDGNKTILGKNIVEKERIKIQFDQSDGEILSARIVETTRDVINFVINHNPGDNFAFIDFEFLDKKDGALIELLHTNSRNVFKINGVIKGIPEGIKNFGRIINIGETVFSGTGIMPNIYNILTKLDRKKKVSTIFFGIVYYIMIIFYLVLGLALIFTYYFPDKFKAQNDNSNIIVLLIGLLLSILAVVLFILVKRKRLPKNLQFINYE